MNKIAFLFPGQGSQAVGMGIDLAEAYPSVRLVFDTADRILGFSLSDMIRTGPEETLKQTVNTQPAVVSTSIAILTALREHGIVSSATAGHSVGEYAALYNAGVLRLEDSIALTRARGEYMHEAGQKYPGTLVAVIGPELSAVEEFCRTASERTGGVVVVANLNNPGQIVISGDSESIAEAVRLSEESGAKVVPLAVSAAFHSPLMKEAAEKLARKLDSVEFSDATIPVYANVTGDPVTAGNEIRELMKSQIVSRVLWEKSIRRMMSDGIDTFVEIGPGKALAGMVKKIDRKAVIFNVNNLESFEKILEKLGKQAVTK